MPYYYLTCLLALIINFTGGNIAYAGTDPASGTNPTPHAGTSGKQETAEALRKLRARIGTLQKQLETTLGRRDKERKALRDVEKHIGSVLLDLRRTKEMSRQESGKLKSLTQRKKDLRGELGRHSRQLARQVRASYIAGKQEYLKVLLNQENPASFSRVLTYYRYFNRERIQRLSAVQQTLESLRSVERQITKRREALAALHTVQERKKAELVRSRTQRRQVLARLNRQVRTSSGELERLRRNERELMELLQKLQGYLADSRPALPGDKGHFGRAKGTLRLPTRGKIVARYGGPKNIGDMRWRGLFLAGQEGQEVISVFRGRVVFADWMRGFGLLLILEHGDGYMTLYGHNQSLYKEVGDWVEAGEVIAGMGATGDSQKPGLYFEIRQNGEPRDPLLWCRSK